MDVLHQAFLDQFCAFSIISENGEIIDINNIYCELSGYGKTELVGQKHQQFIHEAYQQQFVKALSEVVSNGNNWKGKLCYQSKKGLPYWLDTFIFPDSKSNEQGKRYLLYQIPNEKPAKQKDQGVDQSTLYRQLIENSKDLIFTLNSEGHFTFVSGSVTQLLGYEAADLIGIAISSIIHPDDYPGFHETVITAKDPEKEASIEVRFKHKNNRYLWHETSTRAAGPDYENLPPIYGLSRDISDRKEIGQSLTDSVSLFHSLANNIPLSVWRKDREGRITYVNAALIKNVKLEEKDLIGKTNYDLYPKELADKFQDDDRLVMNNGVPFHSVESNIDLITGAPLYLETIKIPVRGRNGEIEGLQGIFWDITEVIESRKKLEMQNEQLTEIAWLHSHKVRGPVATIMGLMNIYDWVNPQNEANVEIVKKVDQVSRELDSIIHDVVKKTGDLYKESEE